MSKRQMYRVVDADKDLQFDKSSSKKDPEDKDTKTLSE